MVLSNSGVLAHCRSDLDAWNLKYKAWPCPACAALSPFRACGPGAHEPDRALTGQTAIPISTLYRDL